MVQSKMNIIKLRLNGNFVPFIIFNQDFDLLFLFLLTLVLLFLKICNISPIFSFAYIFFFYFLCLINLINFIVS